MKYPCLKCALRLVLPTRLLYEHLKQARQGEAIIFQRSWPTICLLIEIAVAGTLVAVTYPNWANRQDAAIETIAIVAAIAAFFRVAEIVYAFYYDAMDKLEPNHKHRLGCQRCEGLHRNNNDVGDEKLGKGDRIHLVMKSYLSLIINWALIYFALPSNQFQGHSMLNGAGADVPVYELQSFVDALYFSSATITTVGYGDIVPSGLASKSAAICEIFSGMLILLLALGAYLADAQDNKPSS